MPENSQLPGLIVRAPWQDELQRVGDLSLGLKGEILAWNLHALVAENPERIVGLAGLGQSEGVGHLVFNVRPRFVDTGGAQLLYEHVIQQARELGIQRLAIKLATGSPVDAFLQSEGFEVMRSEELWNVDLLIAKKRLDRISKRWEIHSDWVVRGINNTDLPAIAELIAPYERLSEGRLRLRGEDELYTSGYEGGVSSVVESNGKLMGAFLCKCPPGLSGYVEFRVVGQEYRQNSGVLGAMMLHRTMAEALKMDYRNVLFTVNVAQDLETRNLAKRTQAVLVRSIRLLTLDLAKA
jgi:N-acetylglutamate synthase-like GNAT family acetyltransferase